MASFTGADGTPLSAAMLTDPKALKKHLANGTPISSHFDPLSIPAPPSIETPTSRTHPATTFVPEKTSQYLEDDTYYLLENVGKNAMASQHAAIVSRASSNSFDPHRLLDPKRFNNDQGQKDSKSAPTEVALAQPDPSSLQPNGNSSESNGKLIGTNVNGLHKRDHEEYEGQGMGVNSVRKRSRKLTKASSMWEKTRPSASLAEAKVERLATT